MTTSASITITNAATSNVTIVITFTSRTIPTAKIITITSNAATLTTTSTTGIILSLTQLLIFAFIF